MARAYGKIEKVRKGASAGPLPSRTKIARTPTSRAAARPIPMRKAQKGEKLTTYETRSIQHGEIIAAGRGGSSYYSPARACKAKGTTDPVTGKTVRGAPRRDQVDLIFAPRNIPKSKHSSRPPPAGPALRFCAAGPGFGPVVPVKDPREAKEIAVAYRACLRDPQKTAPECVEEVTGVKVDDLAFGEEPEPGGGRTSSIHTSRRVVPVKRRRPIGPPVSTAKRIRTFDFKFPWQRR